MARGINKVILIGNVGNDPEIRYMQNGNPVANFSLATTDTWKDKQTGEKQEKTEWHRIVCFHPLGDIVNKYVKKGARLYIEGSLTTRKWQDQQGQDRYTTEIVARDLQLLDSKSNSYTAQDDSPSAGMSLGQDAYTARNNRRDESSMKTAASVTDELDDDVPF